jgi:hypothetical protein
VTDLPEEVTEEVVEEVTEEVTEAPAEEPVEDLAAEQPEETSNPLRPLIDLAANPVWLALAFLTLIVIALVVFR